MKITDRTSSLDEGESVPLGDGRYLVMEGGQYVITDDVDEPTHDEDADYERRKDARMEYHLVGSSGEMVGGPFKTEKDARAVLAKIAEREGEGILAYADVHAVEIAPDNVVESFHLFAADQDWYDGSSESLSRRAAEIARWRALLTERLSSERVTDAELSVLPTLVRTADAMMDEIPEDSPQHVPEDGTEWGEDMGILASGDLGADDGDPLFAEASRMRAEVAGYDWDKFATVGARTWVLDHDPVFLADQELAREAASEYVASKTALLSPERRQTVLERFLQEAGLTKQAPMGDYDDFQDCKDKNRDKDDPDAYCGEIKHRTEDKDKQSSKVRKRSRGAAYNPFSDPESAYNNPNKGPHSGVPEDLFPEGGVPLRGDLTPEQQAWLDKRDGRRADRTTNVAWVTHPGSEQDRDRIEKTVMDAGGHVSSSRWNDGWLFEVSEGDTTSMAALERAVGLDLHHNDPPYKGNKSANLGAGSDSQSREVERGQLSGRRTALPRHRPESSNRRSQSADMAPGGPPGGLERNRNRSKVAESETFSDEEIPVVCPSCGADAIEFNPETGMWTCGDCGRQGGDDGGVYSRRRNRPRTVASRSAAPKPCHNCGELKKDHRGKGLWCPNPRGEKTNSYAARTAVSTLPCARCGKPATWYCYQEGSRASGFPACDEDKQYFDDGTRTCERLGPGSLTGARRSASTDFQVRPPVDPGALEGITAAPASDNPSPDHLVLHDGTNFIHAYLEAGKIVAVERFGGNDPSEVIAAIEDAGSSVVSEEDDDYDWGDDDDGTLASRNAAIPSGPTGTCQDCGEPIAPAEQHEGVAGSWVDEKNQTWGQDGPKDFHYHSPSGKAGRKIAADASDGMVDKLLDKMNQNSEWGRKPRFEIEPTEPGKWGIWNEGGGRQPNPKGGWDFDSEEEAQAAVDGFLSHYSSRRSAESTPMRCNECDASFKKKISPTTSEVKCPRCGGYDTEPSDYFAPHSSGRKVAGFYMSVQEYRNVNPEVNANKYYRVFTCSDRPDWAMVNWGRIGTDGQAMITTAPDAERRASQKESSGYDWHSSESFVLPYSFDLDGADANTALSACQDALRGVGYQMAASKSGAATSTDLQPGDQATLINDDTDPDYEVTIPAGTTVKVEAVTPVGADQDGNVWVLVASPDEPGEYVALDPANLRKVGKTAADQPLMTAVDWPSTSSPGEPGWGVSGLLACGHYSSPVHPASSTWDFPGDAVLCPECGQDRQFDPKLQAALNAGGSPSVEDQRTQYSSRLSELFDTLSSDYACPQCGGALGTPPPGGGDQFLYCGECGWEGPVDQAAPVDRNAPDYGLPSRGEVRQLGSRLAAFGIQYTDGKGIRRTKDFPTAEARSKWLESNDVSDLSFADSGSGNLASRIAMEQGQTCPRCEKGQIKLEQAGTAWSYYMCDYCWSTFSMAGVYNNKGAFGVGGSRLAEEHGGYHLEQDGGKWKVVNHIGEVKSTFDSKEEALKYQSALMLNVPGAMESAESHEEKGEEAKHSSRLSEFYGDDNHLRQVGEDEWACPNCGSTNVDTDAMPSMLGYGSDTSESCNDCGWSNANTPVTGAKIAVVQKRVRDLQVGDGVNSMSGLGGAAIPSEVTEIEPAEGEDDLFLVKFDGAEQQVLPGSAIVTVHTQLTGGDPLGNIGQEEN